MPSSFRVDAPFKPAGDQPQAIEQLVDGVRSGLSQQVLLGVTGSGKTNVMAWAVEELQRPVLVLSPNKTLAAQLCAEFRRLLPRNAVEYFVSYYDYYQPEAYIARTDTYIEKDSSRNEEIDRMRHSTTQALLTRRDVLVVASVSCIYGVGSVEDYMGESIKIQKGESIRREVFLRKLTEMLYERNDYDLARLRFRVRGDVVDLVPANEEKVYRVEFFGDEIERIQELDATTGEILGSHETFTVFPASHYVTPADKLRLALTDIEAELEERCKWFEDHGRLLEAQRLRQRTNFDLEMLRETGTCAGIENYSRHLTRRQPGDAPYTLMDFLPDDTLIFVDESHVAVPQIGGMLGGDRSRKAALVEYGFRLPSAFDNRPLSFEEWEERARNVIYVSATPGEYEMRRSQRTVEMVVRPTGLVDPTVEVRPTDGQIDDLLAEVKRRAELGHRSLVTTLTKRFAEDLADYLREYGVKVRYLHSELDALERIEVLRDLRTGAVDVGGGLAVVTLRNVIHSAVAMMICFGSLAGMYALLGAPIIAAAQVLIYLGAISVLILFAIMLTQAGDASLPAPFHRQAPIAVVIALVVVGLVAWAVVTTAWKAAPTAAAVVIEAIGNLLFTDYALPFEIIGFLLLAAIIGAIFLARRPEEDERAN